jgi:hypothetical protein
VKGFQKPMLIKTDIWCPNVELGKKIMLHTTTRRQTQKKVMKKYTHFMGCKCSSNSAILEAKQIKSKETWISTMAY